MDNQPDVGVIVLDVKWSYLFFNILMEFHRIDINDVIKLTIKASIG